MEYKRKTNTVAVLFALCPNGTFRAKISLGKNDDENVNVAGKAVPWLLSKRNLAKVKMTYGLNGLNSLRIFGHFV